MGLRATVIKTYKVEYGNANGFNYDPTTVSNIICDFCDNFYSGDESTDAIWEVGKEEFADMVSQIRDMPTKEFNERMKEDWFYGAAPDAQPYSKKYILDVFGGWLNETPKDSNYVRIGWL